MASITVGELREVLGKLPDSAGIVIDFLDEGSPLGVTCRCVQAFTIGTSTDDPGLVLRVTPGTASTAIASPAAAAESEPRGAAVASETTAMWTRPNTSSGLFTALRRRGISFRGASK
jgi:hypothetical protein